MTREPAGQKSVAGWTVRTAAGFAQNDLAASSSRGIWSVGFFWNLGFGVWLSVLALLLSRGPVSATSPHLSAINPTGAQRATELEVSFNGDRLQDTAEIICYEPGIQVLKLNLITN